MIGIHSLTDNASTATAPQKEPPPGNAYPRRRPRSNPLAQEAAPGAILPPPGWGSPKANRGGVVAPGPSTSTSNSTSTSISISFNTY